MNNPPSKKLGQLLIASITPYFLEKGNVWFDDHLQEILEARKSQPFFQENILVLEQGSQPGLSPLLRQLDEMGYEKVFEVTDPGEFAQRGGVLDVFPINRSNAVRIEFLGNAIYSIEQLAVSVEDEQQAKSVLKKRLKNQKLFSDLKGLKEGDYLVHLDHGVALFQGIEELQMIRGKTERFYALEYAQGDKLFVPVGLERKLSRYVGFGEPRVARLSSFVWIKTKRKIREETEKLARQLLDLYAQREVAFRKSYTIQSDLEANVAATFPYRETPDQLQAIEEIKEDLQKPIPMDRLVCGDVGFGKTEIALRAIVLAVENGYQAALLAPTTILAHQHFHTLKSRLADTPLEIILLSRFQRPNEQKEAIAKIKTGRADIIIGTHRILSSDVSFGNLGLLVIDDEQRFGVKQKEKLRELRSSLDVLSLSATPIPRTLYMSLSSLKNVSLVQTPPEGRLPAKTLVAPRRNATIQEAIKKELERGGQIYYLHNRIGTIEQTKQHLQKLAPHTRIAIAHAKLSEKELLRVMEEFRNKQSDILVATTIIENGIDLPNVNTLIVDDTPKLGLAQAYQLRGRVGRSHVQSYAYFLYGPGKLPEKARMRLEALEETQELGAGYRIALRDMEIRGAGNILGKEQSGSVNAVGLNLYCQMLSEAVERMRNSRV